MHSLQSRVSLHAMKPTDQQKIGNIDFDFFISNPECRCVFKEYLKTVKCEEMILFWEAVQEYKNRYFEQSIEVLKFAQASRNAPLPEKYWRRLLSFSEEAITIVALFIEDGSKQELNLNSKAKQDSINNCESLKQVIEHALEIDQSADKNSQIATILEYLHPKLLFQAVETCVNIDLKDHFPRFLKSDLALDYISTKGMDLFDSLNRLSDQISFGRNSLYQSFRKSLVLQRMEYVDITDNDVYKSIAWERNFSEWKGFSAYKNPFPCQLSLSKSQMDGMRMGRIEILLPFERDEVFETFTNTDTRQAIENATSIRLISQSFSPCEDSLLHGETKRNNSSLSTHQCSMLIDTNLPLVQQRRYDFAQSTVWDSHLDCIVYISKSSNLIEEDSDKTRTAEKSKKVDGYSAVFFYRDSHDKSSTLIVNIFCYNLKMPLENTFLLKRSVKSRCERLQAAFIDSRERNNKTHSRRTVFYGGKVIFDKLCVADSLLENKLFHPNRSWYKEIKSKRQQ